MRISSLQAFQNGVQGLQRNYAEAIRTQEQINSGNRILTPADDPVASVRLMQLEQQQNMLDQYKGNLAAANNSLLQEESTLNAVNNSMHRVRELALEAGNGALSQHDRQAIAIELQEREEELLGLMNSRNARGEYLFAGFQGKTQPFVREADGSYSYQGDEGQRQLQIGSSISVATGDNGKHVFQNIPNGARLEAATTATGLTVFAPEVEDESEFASFPAAGIEIHFGDPDDDPQTYDVFSSPYAAGDTALDNGVIDNSQEQNSISYGGVIVEFSGVPADGDTISVAGADEKQGVLDTIRQLRTALEDNLDTPADKRKTREAVAIALTNIDHAMVNIDSTRGAIGARLNVIESTQNSNEELAVVNAGVQAELREVDYPEAISRLAFQSVVLEAAQQSFVKVSQLNLFDKIR